MRAVRGDPTDEGAKVTRSVSKESLWGRRGNRMRSRQGGAPPGKKSCEELEGPWHLPPKRAGVALPGHKEIDVINHTPRPHQTLLMGSPRMRLRLRRRRVCSFATDGQAASLPARAPAWGLLGGTGWRRGPRFRRRCGPSKAFPKPGGRQVRRHSVGRLLSELWS